MIQIYTDFHGNDTDFNLKNVADFSRQLMKFSDFYKFWPLKLSTSQVRSGGIKNVLLFSAVHDISRTFEMLTPLKFPPPPGEAGTIFFSFEPFTNLSTHAKFGHDQTVISEKRRRTNRPTDGQRALQLSRWMMTSSNCPYLVMLDSDLIRSQTEWSRPVVHVASVHHEPESPSPDWTRRTGHSWDGVDGGGGSHTTWQWPGHTPHRPQPQWWPTTPGNWTVSQRGSTCL